MGQSKCPEMNLSLPQRQSDPETGKEIACLYNLMRRSRRLCLLRSSFRRKCPLTREQQVQRLLLSLFCVLVVSFFNCQQATVIGDDEGSTTPVVAEGVGLTRDEALKDAYRNAVRQIVGATVDAETVVSQDSVITDKVITLSNGTIKSHKLLSDVSENGLFRLRIVANVKKGEVVQRLRAAKISVKEVDTKNLVADVRSTQAKESAEKISSQQRTADAEALFESALKQLSENFYEISTDGEIKKESVSGDDVTFSYSIFLRPNPEVFKQCSKNLQKALEASTDKHDEFTIEALGVGKKEDKGRREASLDETRLPHSKRNLTVLLNTHANKNATHTEWIAFHIHEADNKIKKIADHFAHQQHQIKVSMLTADDDVVAVDRVQFIRFNKYRVQVPFVLDAKRGKTSNSGLFCENSVLLAPFVFDDNWLAALKGPVFGYALETTIDRKMTLDLEDVAKIKKVRCELIVEK